jgi:predicted nucleic acid-binding protein
VKEAVFLDTNVILDALLGRLPNDVAGLALLELVQNDDLSGYTSSSNIINIIYFLKKAGLSTVRVGEVIAALIGYIQVVSPSANTISQALQAGFSDLEDAIQYFTALRSHQQINFFVTNNTKDFKLASPDLPVLTAIEFMARR